MWKGEPCPVHTFMRGSMPKVKTDDHGRLVLPDELLKRRHLPSNTEYWLDGREGDLIILHPCLPDARLCPVTAVCMVKLI